MASATLFISRAEGQPGRYLAVINGEGFHNSVGAEVAARVRGDDPVFDDSLFSIGVGIPNHVLPDGSFSLSTVVPGSKLNEDWGQDEIYALVDVKGFGSSVRTNTVKGHF